MKFSLTSTSDEEDDFYLSSSDEDVSSDDDSDYSSISSSDDDEDSDDDELQSDLEDLEPWEKLAQYVGTKYKQLTGTSETRLAHRTHPTIKWKRDYDQAQAERTQAMLLRERQMEKKAKQEIIRALVETKDIRRAQKKLNKKISHNIYRKIQLMDTQHRRDTFAYDFHAQARVEVLARETAQALARSEEARLLAKRAKRNQEVYAVLEYRTAEKTLREREDRSYATTVQLGRQMGLLAGPELETKKKNVKIPPGQALNAKSVQLIVDKTTTTSNFFTIALNQYRECIEIKGQAIGPKGASALSQELLLGATPHLRVLNLSWNRIQCRGLKALSAVFQHKTEIGIQVLDLRNNEVDCRALGHLIDAIVEGGLSQLRQLNLQGNVLGDAGAKVIAHTFLRGQFRTLTHLNLRQNNIRDVGGRALWGAFSAAKRKTLGPVFERLDFGRNHLTTELMARFDPCPEEICY